MPHNQYITPALINEAKAMLQDGRDYFPNLRNGMPHGETFGLPDTLALYSFLDGIWLVNHHYDCSMNNAEKLVKLA